MGDYNLGAYLTELYTGTIQDSLPIGLILYNNSKAEEVQLVQNVVSTSGKEYKPSRNEANRFWAKHIDQPVPLFHLLLHYYYLKKINIIKENQDPFSVCWKERMIPKDILITFRPGPVLDIEGKPIYTVAGTKKITYLEKIISRNRNEPDNRLRQIIKHQIDTDFTGDNYYNSVKKNLVTFLKHMQMVDSENRITDRGFKLYNIGLTNGPTSKVFQDYFTKELLITGHHFDLLMDYDSIKQANMGVIHTVSELLEIMEKDYEDKGYVKRNPNRMAGTVSDVKFLKYERILWKSLGLINDQDIIQWKKITEICSMPDFV